MLRITQGHSSGIGPELMLRSLSLISPQDLKLIHLYFDFSLIDLFNSRSGLNSSLKDGKLVLPNGVIQCSDIGGLPENATLAGLKLAINDLVGNDILITMPSTKDQLCEGYQQFFGHTDYLRKKYSAPEAPMVFYSDQGPVALVTEHIALKNVTEEVSATSIVEKVKCLLDNYPKYFSPIDELLLSGINPHAGEGGILGLEDKQVSLAVDQLRILFPKVSIIGPLAADSLAFNTRPRPGLALVFMYHDQGLTYLKTRSREMAINVTLGLPFLRLSPDHGTAFDLVGKHRASSLSTFYTITQALKIAQRL
jgi:4-hydroxythreonine-4-phosphate dehydrogenase